MPGNELGEELGYRSIKAERPLYAVNQASKYAFRYIALPALEPYIVFDNSAQKDERAIPIDFDAALEPCDGGRAWMTIRHSKAQLPGFVVAKCKKRFKKNVLRQSGIINALPVLIEAMPQLIVAIVGCLIENLPKILSAGVRMIGALIQGIVGSIPQEESGSAPASSKMTIAAGRRIYTRTK